MICNTIGLTADSFESIYTTGGTEVEEVYGAIDYAQPIYAKIREMVGTSPLTFTSRVAGTLTDYRISGETIQDGTPSPDYQVDVAGCGVRTENLFNVDRLRSNSFVLDTKYYIFGGRADRKGTSDASTDNVRASISDNVLTVFSTGGSGAGFIVPVFPSTEYTLRFDTDRDIPGERTSCVLNYIDINEELGTFFGIYGNNNAVTFTTNSDTKYVYIVFRYINYEIKYSNILLCAGSAALPYVPYGYCITLEVE